MNLNEYQKLKADFEVSKEWAYEKVPIENLRLTPNLDYIKIKNVDFDEEERMNALHYLNQSVFQKGPDLRRKLQDKYTGEFEYKGLPENSVNFIKAPVEYTDYSKFFTQTQYDY